MIDNIVARARSLWRGLRHRSNVEAEMQDEFRFHVDARIDDLIRGGLARGDAVRQARIEFGSFELYKDQARASRGLRPFDELAFSWLDLKLAFRMLRRYPGLTVIGGLAMAFGIAAGVVVFEFMTQIMNPRLPLNEGERIVALQFWHATDQRFQSPSFHDFVAWREELESVHELSAFRSVGRNAIFADGAETVEVAEITASAFVVARVPPALGRWLNGDDEAPGASPVIVIGHDVWQTKFDGDPGVIGRLLRLGSVQTTIVGVMPAGFAFPVAHSFWAPLSRSSVEEPSGGSPSLVVFGRLAHDVDATQAQAELATLVAASSSAETDRPPSARVGPFAHAIFYPDIDIQIGLGVLNAFFVMLIVLACANVALLMFARAVTREVELAVKNALGANRARLVLQFVTEALVLAGVATLVGLGGARFALTTFFEMAKTNGGGALPFWFGATLTPTTVIYGGALALVAALIAGVLPALKVTTGNQRARLDQLTAGGTGTMRIGGIWVGLIVVQVAVTVLFPAFAFNLQRWASTVEAMDVGVPAEQTLSARLTVNRGGSSHSRTLNDLVQIEEELARRLRSEPGVLAVTFASRPPGALHERAWFELDAVRSSPEPPFRAGVAAVAVDFFAALDAPIVAGRSFMTAEQQSRADVVIVNKPFVDQALGGANPVGRSIRLSARGNREAGPWHEVIGVAPDLGMVGNDGNPGVYFPLDSNSDSKYLLVRTGGAAAPFEPRLRAVAVDVDPDLQLHELMPIAEVRMDQFSESRNMARVLVVVSAVALLLSLMAIYSVVDFTVSKRTREIGLRVALGAAPRAILAATFKRPLIQIGVGIFVGGLLVAATSSAMFGGFPTLLESVLMGGYVILMGAVCMLACVAPTRRALRVQPMDALRTDG